MTSIYIELRFITSIALTQRVLDTTLKARTKALPRILTDLPMTPGPSVHVVHNGSIRQAIRVQASLSLQRGRGRVQGYVHEQAIEPTKEGG